jgi:transcriptional regulator with XRE-family HTH domain
MPSTKDPESPFVDWLRAELDRRGWNMMHLAEVMGVHPSIVGAIMSREKAMGVDTARKVAAALGISQVQLFMLSGLIDEGIADDDAYILELRRLVEGMDEVTRARVLRVIAALADETDHRERPEPRSRPRRGASTASA